MTIRTKERTVTFAQPFSLSTVPGILPPGVYQVSTDEESIGDLSRIAYRRVATTMLVRRSDGAMQTFPIEPTELEAELLADRGLAIPIPPDPRRQC